MESIRINIRALGFDAKTPLSSKDRLILNAKTGNYDVVGPDGSPLRSFGLLRLRDLVARQVLGATDHLFLSVAGHSGEAGATIFAAQTRHVAVGERVATSPVRESDPSVDAGELGPFALGHLDELALFSDAKGEQTVTISALIGPAIAAQPTDFAAHESPPPAIKLDQLALPDDNTYLDATTQRHGLLPKLSGSTSQFLRGDGTWAAVSAGPTTVFELDWSAQPSQLGIGDGTVTVDGIDWTAANTSYATLFQILNGSGLQITAQSALSRDLNDGTSVGSNGPYLACGLETLAAECARYDLPLTIWSYYLAYSVPTSNNAIVAGVGGPGTPYLAQTSAATFYKFAGSGPGIKRGSTKSVSANPIASHNVLIWRSLMDGLVEVFSGEWSGDWPERNQLQLVGRDLSGLQSTFSVTNLLRHPEIALIYGIETNTSSAGAPSFTLARTRIQIG